MHQSHHDDAQNHTAIYAPDLVAPRPQTAIAKHHLFYFLLLFLSFWGRAITFCLGTFLSCVRIWLRTYMVYNYICIAPLPLSALPQGCCHASGNSLLWMLLRCHRVAVTSFCCSSCYIAIVCWCPNHNCCFYVAIGLPLLLLLHCHKVSTTLLALSPATLAKCTAQIMIKWSSLWEIFT